jgi:hypothetical protein
MPDTLRREPAPQPRTTLAAQGPDWIVAEADGTMLPIADTFSAPPGADPPCIPASMWWATVRHGWLNRPANAVNARQ